MKYLCEIFNFIVISQQDEKFCNRVVQEFDIPDTSVTNNGIKGTLYFS